MLIKLVKWDLRATYKKFVAVLVTFALLCIALPGVLFAINTNAAQVCALFTISLGLSALYIVIFVFIVQYYNTSLYSDEGYTTFTLPTAGWRLLLAKMLSALLWMLAASVLILFGMFISFKILETESQIDAVLAPICDFGRFNAVNWVTMGALLILGSVDFIMVTYFSITVSKLSIWRKGGVAMGFVTFAVIYIVQTLPAFFLEGDIKFFTETALQSETAQNVEMSATYTFQRNWISMVVDIAVSLIIYWATTRLLDNTTTLK